MKIKPMYIFEDLSSVKIDKVPVDAIVFIKDKGDGTPRQIIKKSQGTLSPTSTITDFLADSTLFGEISSGGDINGGTY